MIGSGGEWESTARSLFRGIADRTAGLSLCHPVARAAAGWAAKLGEPMRVAVAGEIKQGKSTLVNALVAADAAVPASAEAQDRAVATGQLETTYVLTELTHGSPPSMRVEYRDGTSVQASLTELHAYTVRSGGPGDAALAAVDRVVIALDAPMLRRFRLIDTPGFNSVYGTDAAACLALLTGRELDDADAVLFTIGVAGMSGISRDVVRQFAAVTPLKAIGVVPRVNELWLTARSKSPEADSDLLRWAEPVVGALLPGRGRELFHAVVPVAGLLAEAAALAPDDDFTALQELIRVEPERLATALTVMAASRRAFATSPDFPLNAATRQRLVARFSPWGLYTAVQVARDGPAIPELRRLLDERSGVARLRELVWNHFGMRAGTVRVREGLEEVTRLNRRLRLRLPQGSEAHTALLRVGRDLEGFQLAHQVAFSQVDILGGLYRGELDLGPDQSADLLRLTGERGPGLAARLGLAPGASRPELREAAVAASRRWAVLARTGRNLAAMQMVSRLCDAIQHRVNNGPLEG